MHIVIAHRRIPVFAALMTTLLLIFLSSFLLITQPAHAAPGLNTAPKGVCYGLAPDDSFSTKYVSSIAYTNTMCLGRDMNYNQSGLQFFQFVVNLPGPIKDAVVTAKNGNGQTIAFANTGDDTTYVSIQGSTAGLSKKGMGYGATTQGPNGVCNSADPMSNITINISGNGKSSTPKLIGLCNVAEKDSIISVTPDTIVADNNATSDLGNIEGFFGVVRDGAPVGHGSRTGPFQRIGVNSIVLTNTTTGKVLSGDRSLSANWYSLVDGHLTISGLPSDTYTLEINYNDKLLANTTNPTFLPDWTSDHIVLSFKKFVPKNGTVFIPNADGTMQYYDGQGNPVDITKAAAAEAKLTCGSQVPAVGWIICPIINGLATLNDGMWSLVSGLLTVNPINSTDPIYNAWVAIKNLANIAFVIVFLIIIFSQLTSVGITNYGVKKMLPRLIISAILVNVSFLVIQILVDVSNIIGSSLYSLIVSQAPKVDVTWTDLITVITSTAGAAVIGAAAVAIVGGAAAAFWIVLPMAAMAALGLLAAVLTLIFRQAVIPILAILAPLAFVALLLPNTESWFKKWRSMLVNLLMLYPMAALVFGGAQFAASVIINKSSWWSYLIGMLVLTLPLFSLPFLARQGGPLLTKIGGSLNGLAGKLGKPVADFAAPKRALAEKKYMSAKPSEVNRLNVGKRLRLRALRGKQADTARGSAYDRMLGENTDEDILAGKLDSKLSPETAAREKDAAALRQKKREAELIESGAQNIKRTFGATGTIGAPGIPGGAEKTFAEAFAAGDRIKMLSAMSVLANAGPPGIEKLHSSALGISPSQNPELFSAFQNELNSVPGLKSKDASLSKLAYTPGGNLSEIIKDIKTYSTLSAADTASQTEGSLKRIQAAGAMPQATAKQILANETLSGQLTPVTRKIINDIANGITPSLVPTTAETEAATASTTTIQDAEAALNQAAAGTAGTNPFVVDSAGVVEPNTVQARAEAKIAEAASGTSGDTPFVVDHTGSASKPPTASSVGSHTDEQGRQTPDGAAEGYHDYFNH